jgi:hypothetical protein
MIIPLKIINKGCIAVFVSFLLNANSTLSQNTATTDFDYIHYLIKNNQSRDAIFFLNQTDSLKSTKIVTDSLNYYYGLAYYELKNPDSASIYFKKISQLAAVKTKSNFFESLNLMYTSNYSAAKMPLFSLAVDSSSHLQQQKELQLCGIYLLEGSNKSADSISNLFSLSNHIFSEEQKALKAVLFKTQHTKKKSPFVAALLSTAVPGLGKYYAGRKGQAFASFFSTLGMALIATENLYRGGIKSPQFIITSSIFSIFYIGNIVGSAYSVKMIKKQQALLLDNEIKSAVHKPFRRIFY